MRHWLGLAQMVTVAALLVVGRPAMAAPEAVPFVTGVYWPWETTSVCGQGEERAKKLPGYLEARLDDLAAHQVNLVWTVNGPDSVEETALLCRLADRRGIQVVAGSGWWAMHAGNANDQWVPSAVARVKEVWEKLAGQARPIAFTLADEPRTAFMEVFGRFVKQVSHLGIPATTVAMWGDYPAAIEKAPALKIICQDNYPFFGSPNGPRGDASYGWFITHIGGLVRRADEGGMVPWAMPQAYQEIWGPAREEADGTMTVLPGGGTHWVMPTPAQIRWETWASVALGAKGVVYFTYGVTAKPDPKAEPLKDDWARRVETPTGEPMSLVSWPDYRPSRQYAAMAQSFVEIRPLEPTLLRLRSTADEEQLVRLKGDETQAGDLANLLRDPGGGELYAAIVASPKREGAPVSVLLNPNVSKLEPLRGAPAVKMTGEVAPFSTASVPLEPGQGALYRVHTVKRMARRVLFREDFASDDFAQRATEVRNVKPEGEAGRPRVLRATVAEMGVAGQAFPACGCYLTYELGKLIAPPVAPRSVRLLEYDGYGVSPDAGQGVFIWAGPSLEALQPLVSSAAPRQIIRLPADTRCIKIGISFRQATPDYAGLRSWSVVEWTP